MTPLGSDQARAMAAKRWAKPRPGEPFAGTFLEFMELAGLTGESWGAWRVHWKAVDALPMTEAELAIYRRATGRRTPPEAAMREVVDIAGRRSGKTRGASARAFYEAIRRDYRALLAPGERAVIPVIAADRKQAGQAFGYIARGLARLPELVPYVARTLKESIELTTGVTIEVHTASYRTTRGYTVVALVADEISFWVNLETGANPDTEILAALRPGMATVPGALLIMVSTPYSRRGELYRAYERYFGKADPRVLVWMADTATMNPTLDPAVLADAFTTDPVAAASEYGQGGTIVFRTDVEAFLSPEAVAAVTMGGRLELPPVSGASYVAFVDPSGGSADSFTLAIAHAAGAQAVAVLDLLREVRPPFSPSQVVEEYAQLLRSYRLSEVTGDHWGGVFPVELFAKYGITYFQNAEPKSDVYRQFLPLVNAKRAELLDLPRLRAQLLALERRTARGGKDSIDHLPGGHDDVANAAAGALVLAVSGAAFPGWSAFEWVRRAAAAAGNVSAIAAGGPGAAGSGRPTIVTVIRPGGISADVETSPVAASHLGACGRCGHVSIGTPPPVCPTCGGTT